MPIRYVKGVGPKKGEYLAQLGVHTVRDLLYYQPRKYEDRSKIVLIKEVKDGEQETVQGVVRSCSAKKTRRGIHIFQITVEDDSGVLKVVWFNQPFLSNVFTAGQHVILYGKVEKRGGLQMHHPEFEIADQPDNESIHVGRIVPIYSLSGQLTQRYLRSLIDNSVKQYSRYLHDALPTNIRARERLVDIKFAVENIHFPGSFEHLEKAHRRLVFEEFFFLQLALAAKRRSVKEDASGIRHRLDGDLIRSFNARLPFKLTEGQVKSIAEIEKDMSSERPMNRLLEGDVGSGKTIVAAHALALTAQNGYQGVLMAPTEVLARQHYILLCKLFMPIGVNVVLLVQGIAKEKKEGVCAEILQGKAQIIVGTHAIIQEGVHFDSVGLIVVDEQHKFGVTQRALLREKGRVPHTLIMTATPIPRTLALTVYGDLDVSIIEDMPKGRKPIVTYWVEEEKREEVYSFVKEELKKKRQAYIVYPLIESSSRVESKSAKDMYHYFKEKVFSSFRVGLLHGRMSSPQKDSVMKEFKRGEIDVLVSTVVIEVGIDVPNATCMVVENAERFGLSQLHQLRGRIGRGVHESYCILLADPRTELAQRRLKAIEETIDGFQIAEEDLALRGPGEFLGTKQHGLPEIRFGDIIKDFDIMQIARKEAFLLMREDPGLSEDRHGYLKKELIDRYRDKLELGKVG